MKEKTKEQLIKELTELRRQNASKRKETDQELRAANKQFQATEQQLKAANQQLEANNQQLRAEKEQTRERMKELQALYALSEISQREDLILEEMYQEIVKALPLSWQYPDIACARIVVDSNIFSTENFIESAWKQSADIRVHKNVVGKVEVVYLKERPEQTEDPFLKEERLLINAIAERLGRIIERKQAEEKLKAANQQLVASEQQLKAANQQLKANNQQLRASDQQLRAANQQLSASEQQLKSANQQLKESEEKYRTLITNINDIVMEIDSEGKFTYLSPQIFDVFGYTQEECIGLEAFDFIHPDDIEKYMTAMATLDEVKQIEYRSRHKDGHYVHVSTSGRYICDESGEHKIVLVLRDITERKQAEETLSTSEAQLSNALQMARAGHWEYDIGRDVFTFNDNFYRIFRTTAAEVGGYQMSSADYARRFCHPDDAALVGQENRMVIESSDPNYSRQIEHRILYADGEVGYITVRFFIVKDAQGKTVRTYGVNQDITERKKAELELQMERDKFISIFESMVDGVYIVNRDYDILYINPVLKKSFGSPEGKKCHTYFHDSDEPCVFCKNDEVFAGKTVRWEWTSPRNGRTYDLIDTPIINSDGSITKLEIFRDITERKQSEDALRESEEKHIAVVENSKDGIIIHTGGTIKFVNSACTQITGYSKDEIIDKNMIDFISPEDRETVARNYADRMAGKETPDIYEIAITKKDGSLLPVEINVSIMDYEGKPSTLVYLRDLTERKEIQNTIARFRIRRQRMFQTSSNPIFLVNSEDNKIEEVNPAAVELTGYNRDELIGEPFTKIIPEDSEEVSRILKKAEEEEEEEEEELRISAKALVTKSGEKRIINAAFSYCVYRDKPLVQVIANDITEHRKAEAALKESEDRYGALFENMSSGVAVYEAVNDGRDFIFKGFNKAGENIEKINREQLLGRSVLEVFPGIKEFGLFDVFQRVWKTGKPEQAPISFYEDERIAGWRDNHVFKIPSGEIVAIYDDLTVQKQAEQEKAKLKEQLLQTQKMDAIGTLAGGVAHDFNNILTVIKGTVQLTMLNLDESNALYSDMGQIKAAADRAADLTRQLLLYSQKQSMDFVLLNINDSINSLLKMLKRLIGEDIVIHTELVPDVWTVRADRTNFDQILMNISVNARDAMPKGGRLVIRTQNAEVEDDYVSKHSYARCGKFVCLSIEDTGTGMDLETQEHIFEPFFTTKGLGKGTGMGMSVVFGIVKEHDGWIEVESDAGKGAKFNVYLPVSLDKEKKKGKGTGLHKNMRGNGQRILVIEDEKSVLETTVRTLEEHGYTVLKALDAKGARKIFRKEQDNIDLVFSDIVLPDQDGLELAEQLLAEKPGIPVLLTSGYPGDKVGFKTIKEKDLPFIQKPYDIHELLRIIKECLTKK